MTALRFFIVKTVRFLILSILALCIPIWVTSCEASPFGLNRQGYEDLSEDLDSAWRKTASFKYMVDDNDYWKSPREFEHDGGGDCEDFSAYLMYHLGEKSEIYFIQRSGHTTSHAIVKFDGKFIEPQSYGRTYSPAEFEVLFSMDYEEAMRISTHSGLKNEIDVKLERLLSAAAEQKK